MIVVQSLSDGLSFLGESQIRSLFNGFKCQRDDDLEIFLHKHAINYEMNNVARTFFVMDDDYPGEILGYFSIGLNVMHLEIDIPVDDAYEGINLYEENYHPVYKLFMIAKNEKISNHALKMSTIFDEVILKYLTEAKKIVGANFLYIDCLEELASYYNKLGFIFFDKHEKYDKNKLIRMIRVV